MAPKSGGQTTTVSRNVITQKAYSTFKNNSECIRLVNTEVLGSYWPITGTNTFGVLSKYNDLKGLQWANQIGGNFSLYRFKKLKFTYRPTVGTTASGYIAMAFVSDPEDVSSVDTFTEANTLTRLSSCRRYVQAPVWQEVTMEIRPGDFSQDWYLYEPATINDQATARQCAAGGIFIAAKAPDANSTGVVYVEYELELKDPVPALVNR